MKGCAICGRPTDRSGFCADCKAALQRARDETISRFQPFAAAPELEPTAGAGAIALAGRQGGADETGEANRPRALPGRLLAAVGAVVAVAVAGYAAYELVGATGDRPVESVRSDVQTPRPAAAPVPAAEVAQKPVITSVPAPSAPSAAESPVAVSLPRMLTPPPVKAAPHPAEPTRAPPNAVPARPTSPPREEPAIALPPSKAAAAAPIPSAEPRPDRWQRMDEALRGCATEALFARIVCEQKVRFEYCDGQWGQNRRCPGNPGADHGQ